MSIGCSVPEIKVGARLYHTAGPFISVGPKVTLRSGAEGGLSGRYSFDVGVGVEADQMGWGSMKADIASWNIRDERTFF